MRAARLLMPALLLCLSLSAGCLFDGPGDLKMASRAILGRSYDQAVRLTSRALLFGGLDKKDKARAYRLRAQAAVRLQKLAPALEDYGRALELEPDNAAALLGRGSLWLVAGRYDQARQDLQKGLAPFLANGKRLHRRLSPYLARLAQARFYLGLLPQAWRDCDLALAADPNQPLAYLVKSLLAEKQGLKGEALEYMEKAWALKSRSGSYSLRVGGDPWIKRLVRLRMAAGRDPMGRDRKPRPRQEAPAGPDPDGGMGRSLLGN